MDGNLIDRTGPEIHDLLHPSRAYDRPRDVVDDPGLSLSEKRAILASWASDGCAVEAAPTLRKPPSSRTVVQFDEIMDALRSLDREMEAGSAPGPTARARRNARLRGHDRARGPQGLPLH